MAEKDDLVAEGREMFELCAEAEQENREAGRADLRFARNGEQWPDDIRKQREKDGRPCLTINTLPAFARQVVNDARMNKPAIKVHAQDDRADPETAELLADLIRNIEYTSNAAAAYDTALESAVFSGVGYWRIGLEYAYDDVFDLDLLIKRIRNPFSVYGDPFSTAVDSSDWNVAFVVDRMRREAFERKYKGKATVDFSSTEAWGGETWLDSETVQVAEWWSREEVERDVSQFFDKRDQTFLVIPTDEVESNPDLQALLNAGIVEFRRSRLVNSYRVRQRIMTGADIIKDEVWPGRYIPIVPVYGDEYDIDGKVYRRSLVHDAKGAQQMKNYWRSASTELVALAPRVPFIGPENFAEVDERWETVNSESHPYLEYKGNVPPQRQPLDSGTAVGAFQEALAANDDIKSIIGLYDASLGARSNEVSGRAILARQREGDVSTFHFTDNQSRAIQHTGTILIDLIPHVYSSERIVRVRGEDQSDRTVKINAPFQKVGEDGQPQVDGSGNPVMAIHDLTVGKYDVTVTPGPSFTTKREESAAQMMAFVQAYPQAAPIVGDLLAKALDWPGADEIAKRLHNMVPPQALGDGNGIPPQVMQMIQQGQEAMKKMAEQIKEMQADKAIDMAKVQNDARKVDVDAFRAQTDRMEAEASMATPVIVGTVPTF